MKSILICLFLTVVSCGDKHSGNHINYLDQARPEETPLVFAPNIISKQGRFEMGFTMSSDGNRMAFGVFDGNSASNTGIYFLERTNEKWSVPNNMFLPENTNTFFPMFGLEKDEFYFAKSINGGETDIFKATFIDGKIKSTEALDSVINSDMREAGHGMAESGVLYFTSNRGMQNGEIYRSYPDEKGNYSSVQKVSELSSDVDEESLFLSPNEDYIILQVWKEEFKSKHDLYISYRTKSGIWTVPERLNNKINGTEIEHRPFVSRDNNYLFFSRISVVKKNGADSYESDIYWVDTQSIFKPYVYNSDVKIKMVYNEEFQIKIPTDLFKDIDDSRLSYSATMEDGSNLPKWIKLDGDILAITGRCNSTDSFVIILKATDSYGNNCEVRLPVEVQS